MVIIKSIATSALVGLIALNGCGPVTKNKAGQELDSPTAGKITIAVDASFEPIVRSTIQTFEAAYKDARIKPLYTSENEAFAAMLKDSARVVVAGRRFNKEELAYFKKRQITPQQLEYAIDAVAFLLHPKTQDTIISITELAALLSGQIKTWPDGQAVVPVVDNANSSNLNYLRDTLQLPALAKSIYAVGSNEEVIKYVASHPGALGVIGLGAISDTESPSQGAFRKTVKVAAISSAEHPVDSNSYQPYQAYLALKKYPLARKVYLVSSEARSGLGTGFMSWAVSDKGQRIILKAGLLPAQTPMRIVNFNK